MASTLALRGVPTARRAEGPPSCSARASRATAGGVRASLGRPRLAHAPWHSATPPPRAKSSRARALAVDRGEALGDDDDALAELLLQGTGERSRRARSEAGDERCAETPSVAVASEEEHLEKTSFFAAASFDEERDSLLRKPSSDDAYDTPPRARVLKKASLGDYCTLGVGGPARAVVEAYTIDQLVSTLKLCASLNVRSVVIGKGSNVLFSDKGFDGVVIVNRVEFVEERIDYDRRDSPKRTNDGESSNDVSFAKELNTEAKKPNENETRLFRCGSGTPFNFLGASLSKSNWSGLEFAAGVPGTAGGAAFMNAGADGQDTASALESVELVSPCGGFFLKAKIVSREEVDDLEDEVVVSETSSSSSSAEEEKRTLFVSVDAFGYRRSPFMEPQNADDRTEETVSTVIDGSNVSSEKVGTKKKSLEGWIVTAVTFRLTRDYSSASRAKEFMRRRRVTQPLAERSVGCLFRNPGVGMNSAGALIDRAGLKNFAVGAARVSSTHANFLVLDDHRLSPSSSVLGDECRTSERLEARGSSSDMEALIAEVKARVLDDSGLVLEEEVRRVPFRLRAEPPPKKKSTPAEDDGENGASAARRRASRKGPR